MVVSEYYGLGRMEGTMFGFEIELENCVQRKDVVTEGLFHVTEDGSLRNTGLEFVSVPLHKETYKEDYKKIVASIKDSYPTAEASGRCGLHIHTNVRDMTIKQVGRFLTLYCLVEAIIFQHAGERNTNHFCVPLTESEYAGAYISAARASEDSILRLVSTAHKYAAFNIKTVGSLGTVESRHLPGAYWDSDIPLELAAVINNLRTLAMQPIPLEEFIQDIRCLNMMSNYEQFLNKVFGDRLLGVDCTSRTVHNMLRAAVFLFKVNSKG